jgi:hypothetical protein
LMWILSEEGRLPFCSLAFYQRLFDIPVAANPLLDADAISGADIARLVAEGSSIAWAKICAHCHRDIELTAALARRIRVLPEAQPLAVQHGLFSAGRADA